MTDICRLCASLKTLEQLQQLDEPKLSLKNKLARCCQFELPTNDDFLPQNACRDCILFLNKSWAFAEKVNQAQEVLKRAFLVDYNPTKNDDNNSKISSIATTTVPIISNNAAIQDIKQVGYKVIAATSKGTTAAALTTTTLPSINYSIKRPQDLSFKTRSIIISLHIKGYTNDEISKKLQIPESLVVDWIFTYQAHKNNANCHQTVELIQDQHEDIVDGTTVAEIVDVVLPDVVTSNDDRENLLKSNIFKKENIYELTTDDQLEFQTISTTNESSILPIDSHDHQPSSSSASSISSQNQQEISYNEYNINGEDADEDNVNDEDENETGVDNDLPAMCSGEEEEEEDEGDDNDNIIDEQQEQQMILSLNDIDKLDNGRITDNGCNKLNFITWFDYPWTCYECGKQFKSVKELNQHSFLDHDGNSSTYLCIDCNKLFGNYQKFIKHVCDEHRSYLKFCCDVCCQYFWNIKALKIHQITDHHDESSMNKNAYLCQICGKACRSSSALQVHFRSHLPNDIKNKYKCDICYKKFGTKPNLTAHKRIHTGIRDYTCDQCGKSFIQKGNLDNHMLTHVPTKPYTCDVCRKSFKTELRLIKHQTVHTGFKPHKCDVCGREFREKSTLREHIRIHTGAMPFSCEFCGKRFRFKGVLTTHRRVHTGERPYSCVECNHHFTNWPNYNKHMKRRHGINTSVTVRKPQTIPPSGMPAEAKLNHVVPTTDNLAFIQQQEQQQQQNSTSVETINDEVDGGGGGGRDEGGGNSGDNIGILHFNDKVNTTTSQQDLRALNQQTAVAIVSADVQQSNSECLSRQAEAGALVENSQLGTQITVLAHPSRAIQHVLNTGPQTGQQITTQYSYLPAGSTMLGFYSLQGVDIDLLQNATNLQR